MTSSTVLKRKDDQNGGAQSVCSLAYYAIVVFDRLADPDRKRYRKTDVQFGKYIAEVFGTTLALKGPKALDDASAPSCDRCRIHELPAFAPESASLEEWRYSLAIVSRLSSTLNSLICSRDTGDALHSDMFETLGMLAFLETRIAKVLEAL